MEIIKKYACIELNSYVDDNNSTLNAQLSFGAITGPYYSRQYPEIEFDTEEKAIEHAYKTNPYSVYLIVPIIRFKN